jgi:uncharacterized YigZ family protein
MNNYRTISAPSEGIYKEKGSKFLAFAYPVTHVDEVKELIKTFKKDYFDARHICYAYMLGADRKEFRAVDDGEPSGTAGKPILGQINSKNLTNILVVVVRYFGGVLLGTGGLTTAYKEATIDALCNATIIDKNIEWDIDITFNYLQMNDVMKIIKDTNATIIQQQFDNVCLIKLRIENINFDETLSKLKNTYDLKIGDYPQK